MELRELTTSSERQTFADCLAQARATRGPVGFRQKSNSKLACAHLAFGRLYGLYDEAGDGENKMLAGFGCHDLTTLPQSFPKPDLTHIPAQHVFEGGELWSLSRGVGRIARYVAGIVFGLVEARAVLLYSFYKPTDLTPSYRAFGFEDACEPVIWPYAETVDGRDIIAQPLILQGQRLEAYVRSGFEHVRFVSADRRVIELIDEAPIRPAPAGEREHLQMTASL